MNWVEPWGDFTRCPSVNIVNITAGILVLASSPKAGSTTLREVMHRFPWYVNANGQLKGEENLPVPCELQEKKFRELSGLHNLKKSLSVLIVREPLDRFISGVREVFINHCRDLPRWGLAVEVCSTGPGEGQASKGTSQAKKWTWNTTVYVEQYLDYESQGGFLNVHTTPLSLIAMAPFQWPHHEAGSWDAIVRLEFAEDWANVIVAANTPHLPGKLVARNQKPRTDHMLTPRAWSLFCELHAADYACLNYDLPLECQETD
jgi:hypothetical protein